MNLFKCLQHPRAILLGYAAVFAAAMSLGACSSAPKTAAANPVKTAAAATPAKTPITTPNTAPNKAIQPIPAKPSFLWEVRSATNTVYLFGTIHVGKRSFYPLADAVEGAFKQSAKLVVEADITKQVAQDEIRALTDYREGEALSKRIPKPILARTGKLLERFQIPVPAAERMKPFMVGALVSMMAFDQLGYEINYGVDGYLIEAAQRRNIPVLELESQLGQIAMLSTLPDNLQEAFLDNAVAAIEKDQLPAQLTGLVAAWQSGDAAKMQTIYATSSRDARLAKELDEAVLFSRHPAMVNKITGYLAEREPHFVAVGSLHLVGPRGLVEILRARGYQVRQL